MKKWLWLTIISLVLIGFFSVMELGSTYFGKSYLDTADFESDYDYFENQLIALELDPPDAESAASITSQDIEEYRTRYGSLSGQIMSIQDQYNLDIEEAAANGNDSLEEILTEERDSKIDAIRNNFSDDDIVREKIQAEREALIEQIVKEMKTEIPYFFENYNYYVYNLTNTETGETFSKGETQKNPYFEKTYTAGNPLVINDNNYLVNSFGDGEIQIPPPDAKFEGTVQIDRSLLAASDKGEQIEHFTFVKIVLYILGALAIAGTIFLLVKLPFKRQWFTELPLYGKWAMLSIEIRFFMAFLSLMIALLFTSVDFLTTFQYSWSDNTLQYGANLAWHFLIALAFLGVTVLQIVWLLDYYKSWNLFDKDFKSSFTFRSLLMARKSFLKKTIGVQMLILLIVIFFWGLGTMLIVFVREAIILWIPATIFIGLPVLLFMLNRFGYLNVLMEETGEMAAGRLNQDIPVRGKSALADHARQLNLLKEGVRQSMSEQAKSERLKTELITNVSHDLRTPLTSIITYTDLLKTPNLSDEERLAYADILDRKSQRLKTLIEDLFEVSKMASGNMELHRQQVDFTQLMAQALAEHAEDIGASGLDFRVSSAKEPVYIYADGQKWWRVLDNLIVNAIKYALPGTRVYVSLKEIEGQAEFIMKNVTRYEIGENTDELFERFKRGDQSRQTEGSGLGLAIAQSIVELHGGVMKIEVDGDLFKITIAINKIS